MAELRVGDSFELVGTIVNIVPGGDLVRVDFGVGEADTARLFARTLLAGKLVKRALAVGDKVTWGGKTSNYFIQAISASKAWLRPESQRGTWMTMNLADLERP